MPYSNTHARAKRLRAISAYGKRLLAGSILSIVAIAGGASPSSSAEAKCEAPEKVVLGQFQGSGVALTSDIAVAKGFYDEIAKACPTTIEIATFTSPQAMVSGLIGKQLNFALFTPTNSILSALQGQEMVNLVNLGQSAGLVFFAGVEHKDRGTGLDALKTFAEPGSVWALTSLKTLTQSIAMALIEKSGGDPSAIDYVSVGIAGVGPAVVSGKAVIGAGTAMQAGQLVSSGQVYPVFNTGGRQAYDVAGFQPALGLHAMPEFVESYPVLAQKLIEAHLKGLFFIQENRDNPKAVYDLMPDTYRAQTGFDVFEASWKWNSGFFLPVTGLLSEEDIKNVNDFMMKIGTTSKPGTVRLRPDLVAAAYEAVGRKPPTESIDISVLDQIPNN